MHLNFRYNSYSFKSYDILKLQHHIIIHGTNILFYIRVNKYLNMQTLVLMYSRFKGLSNAHKFVYNSFYLLRY